ncbi:Anaerobic selenocysteine-containing dehydrogenase [Reichenbachiella faecimaris]|uniref:Anaerobic selenocysteine-containing dehydrogenase n=1 Tax=Reichenbachiella faecimaris TaxID=692418 RepID=A0A1W2GJL8_REIFA|nr:molybdopterin-dependent oxidoreductase [Reichenbachiella faecimaris]SMD36781.1 Anaerobic selenocysteine-containing dehydrogenase [Reichenbachiella faecimaris]
MPQTHYRTCNLCEAMCGLVIEHDGKAVISIKGDMDDEFSQGHICPKALALKDIYEDPNRLKKPVKKTESGWMEIPWDQAIKDVTDALVSTRKKYGSDAVGVYSGNPNVHNSGAILSAPEFIKELRTKNKFSATSVDQLPHQYMAYLMYGHQLQIPIPDIDRTDFLIILGANPIISNGSLLSAPNIKKRLKNIQERGGKIVNIDPRYTETSAKSDQHLFIRPGSDVFMLLSMLHVLFDENLVKLGRFEPHQKGFEELHQVADNYSPDKTATITGIEPEVLKALTKEFANTQKAVLYGRMGVCTQEFGGMCMWLVNVLNILTGHFDEPGGYMFTTPAIDLKPQISKGHIGKWKSRVRGLPEVGGELPSSVMAEEMMTPGEGQIKAMVISAGNPVLSTPNGAQLEKAFESLDFMVSIDIYINETSKLANIILPPATGLETELYDVIFHTLAVRNTSKYSTALFEKSDGAKYDWEVFRGLKMAYLKSMNKMTLTKRLQLSIAHLFSPEKMLNILLKKGPYDLSIKKLKQKPHGIDLGALKSQMPASLYSKDKKINLFPNEIKIDLERVKNKFETYKPERDFLLIGRRQLRTCNSWLHNSQRLLKNNSCHLYLHPEDAQQLGLSDNGNIRVSSRVGQIVVPFETTEEIMPGVVSLPHGWGHKGAIKLDVASTSPGTNINELTDDHFVDQLTGNAAINGVPVNLEAC